MGRVDRRRDELPRLCADGLKVPAENPPGDTRAIAGDLVAVTKVHVGTAVDRLLAS